MMGFGAYWRWFARRWLDTDLLRLTGDLPLGKFSPPSRKFQLDVRLDDVVLRALETPHGTRPK